MNDSTNRLVATQPAMLCAKRVWRVVVRIAPDAVGGHQRMLMLRYT